MSIEIISVLPMLRELSLNIDIFSYEKIIQITKASKLMKITISLARNLNVDAAKMQLINEIGNEWQITMVGYSQMELQRKYLTSN